jgi:subtilisin family serine protease
MKNIFFFLLIVIVSASCKTQKTLLTEHMKPIPGRYIVFMKDAFAKPVVNERFNDDNRKVQRRKNRGNRNEKKNKLKNYLREKGIDSDRKSRFADIKVMAVVTTTAAKARELMDDKANVENVVQDITIQINPIQQSDPTESTDPLKQWLSDPVPNINPIQQSEDSQNRYEIDPGTNVSRAIIAAGGPVSSPPNGPVIWFLDTGIDHSRYLNRRVSLGANCIGTSGVGDDFGHGTFCAGVAAGKPVGNGAPGNLLHIGVSEGAAVVPVKVLDGLGKGSWSSVLAGLDHVSKLSQPGDIVNLSLGAYDLSNCTCDFPELREAIEKVTFAGNEKNVFVSMSAGNNNQGNAGCNLPGCINGDLIFTTSSINIDRTCALYANFGIPPVDYATVGTRVFSLWNNGAFRLASGTSVSSAILAGIIHARGGKPAAGGTVNCITKDYIIGVR